MADTTTLTVELVRCNDPLDVSHDDGAGKRVPCERAPGRGRDVRTCPLCAGEHSWAPAASGSPDADHYLIAPNGPLSSRGRQRIMEVEVR